MTGIWFELGGEGVDRLIDLAILKGIGKVYECALGEWLGVTGHGN